MTKAEKDQRVQILRRLKEHLQLQRKRFFDYLDVLDKEKKSIQQGRIEDLQAQIGLEETLVQEISAVQKVIVPLEEVYRASNGEEDTDVEDMRTHLERLRETASERNKTNRMLLSSRMEEVRKEMASMKPRRGAKLYQNNAESRGLIDITT